MSGFDFSSTFCVICGEAMQYILGLFSTVVFEESIHLSNSENIPRCPSARQVSGDSDEDSMSSPLSDCSHEIKWENIVYIILIQSLLLLKTSDCNKLNLQRKLTQAVSFTWSDSDQRDNVERILCSDIWMWKTLSGKCR